MGQTVCFIGHRDVEETAELRARVHEVVGDLIAAGAVDFIFGDHSAFDHLCYAVVSELKEQHPAIRRIHFRRDYEDADAYTMRFLLAGYEESVCPKGVGRAGRASYVERNRAMVAASDVCVFYCDTTRAGGTTLAYAYAEKIGKPIINLAG